VGYRILNGNFSGALVGMMDKKVLALLKRNHFYSPSFFHDYWRAIMHADTIITSGELAMHPKFEQASELIRGRLLSMWVSLRDRCDKEIARLKGGAAL